MKNPIIGLTILILILACNSNKKLISSDLVSKTESICPDDGVCTFEVLQGKSIRVAKSSIGEMYPDLNESNKVVLKFDYKRNDIPDVQDSSYNEIIFLEIDPDNPEIELKGKYLSKAKLIFARFCFCRGQTGYYHINEGELNIKRLKAKTYSLDLDFKSHEVPQIITSIRETFTLE